MSTLDTLTAYIMDFSFMERNNPLFAEQRDAIRSGEKPDYTFENFVPDYTRYTEWMAIGENTDRGILLSDDYWESAEIDGGVKRWHMRPRAGKQGKPVTVFKTSTRKEYNYDADSAALYEHHVFFYKKDDLIIAVFYRQNGSGCKSVFLETANKMLKPNGYKLGMTLCIPPEETIYNATASKITLQYVRSVVSSDIADNKKRRPKNIVIKDLGLNLEADENSAISKIVREFQLGKIPPNDAFIRVQAECADGKDYNDAEIQLRIGGRKRTVRWNDMERAMGSYDITNQLSSAQRNGQSFIVALTNIADAYCKMVIDDLTKGEEAE